MTAAAGRRARDLGIDLPGRPGADNAITDVPGVEVGCRTLISGEGALVRGKGPVRTGVTAILPRSRDDILVPLHAAIHALNGNGELTGSHWIEESGQLVGPLTLTNTHSVGIARDATVRWMLDREGTLPDGNRWFMPVAAETYDGMLNDIDGLHVREADVLAALDMARPGPVALGSFGGGTGMICYGFKGGNGSASRQVAIADSAFTLGVFVQANFGLRHQLTIAGVPVGRALPEAADAPAAKPGGSIIAVVATDAPLLPWQLKRLARRIGLGLARTGSVAHNSSGDIFIAFSTGNADVLGDGSTTHAVRRMAMVPDDLIDPLFTATVEATEEAVLDALFVNESMTGRDGFHVPALPHDRVIEIMRAHRPMAGAS